tara:strand:- start:225 stop:620 length:396 start_codon:yes stop_codon:yes gene_type:complete
MKTKKKQERNDTCYRSVKIFLIKAFTAIIFPFGNLLKAIRGIMGKVYFTINGMSDVKPHPAGGTLKTFDMKWLFEEGYTITGGGYTIAGVFAVSMLTALVVLQLVYFNNPQLKIDQNNYNLRPGSSGWNQG